MDATFSSRLINLTTLEYPLTLWDIRARHPNYIFGDVVPANSLAIWGYAVVMEVPMPEGEVITEAAPELIEGQWTQVWESRDYNATELALMLEQSKMSAFYYTDEAMLNVMEEGIPFTFAGGPTKLRLNPGSMSQIAHQADAGVDSKVLGAKNRVYAATAAELATASTQLQAKYQSLLAAVADMQLTIDTTPRFDQMPSQEDIQAAIRASVQ